jgi:hypothetical protein
VAFNIGVELGQVLVLALLIPALQVLFRFVVGERMGTIILAALVAHTGWHWMTERWENFRKFPVVLPAFNAATLAAFTKWAALILAVSGVIWALSQMLSRARSTRTASSEQSQSPRARRLAWFS